MPSSPLRFVTLSGVPIEITDLKWPFHQSTSGADWYVLHGRADLLEGPGDLHAEVAVGMTQTIKETIGSLEPGNTEGLVVNAIRKTIDNGQIAFMKSGKLQPAHVTSRFYNFREKKIQFPTQTEQYVREMLKRRVFWLGAHGPVDIAHPYDCQYVNFAPEKMIELAGQLASEGLIQLQGTTATATEELKKHAGEIRAAMQKGVEAGLAATRITA
ncbi:MAG TPA: hypothetical protein VHA33_22055 [Candidatus Angelobacter sp.]|jgi:hypothetical protein|nr:hypothetical protein [Candidatus Angelobacter sp.]